MQHKKKFLASLASAALLAACGSSSNDTSPDAGGQNIIEIASANPDLSTLVAAVTRGSLVTTLEGPGPFTVFAPTNEAFAALKAAGVDATQLDVPTLTSVLKNHVVSGADLAATIEASSTLTSLTGTLNVNVTGGAVYLNGLTKITQTDIIASNGVVHVIDSVLLPNTNILSLVGLAVAYPRLSSLGAAVTSANLATTLEGTGLFTLFAPDNAAFAALSSAPSASALPGILEYHVISGNVSAAQAIAVAHTAPPGNEVTTLDNGEKSTLTLSGSTLKVNNANVIYTNIGASNGTLHVIDTVLIPN